MRFLRPLLGLTRLEYQRNLVKSKVIPVQAVEALRVAGG
jgi:hypothetical protein